MMMNEFIERTGIEPTAEEYNEIEEAYYKFDGDKDAFCKHWKETVGADAVRIQRRVVLPVNSCRHRVHLLRRRPLNLRNPSR